MANLALQLAVLALLIAAFFVRLPQVSGFSMEPHIRSGEYVLINTFAYRLGQPRRGDIVAFRHEGDARAVFIKRVIGLPGDRVRIVRGQVYLNGRTLDEPYVQHAGRSQLRGDDGAGGDPSTCSATTARESEDSRFFGAVSDDRLIGRAIAGIWPPRMLGTSVVERAMDGIV